MTSTAGDARDTDLLIRRASFGPDGAIEVRARELGWQAFVEEQLRPETIDDAATELRITWDFPELMLTAKENFDIFEQPAAKQRAATLLRAVFSKRQLFERVVEFWNDHFSIDQNAGECRVLKMVEDRSAIRAHAFGRFRELLEAVTKSAAMMEYLDNRENRGVAPNENFARELLELHTLGVGEYTEHDVKEVARCFTGWTIRPCDTEGFGEFVFDAAQHDDGPKIVLGRTIPAHGGDRDGQIVLDMVAQHPATARRLAVKLCTMFVTEEPQAQLVERVACAFLDSQGDMRATLRALLRHEHFAGDDASARPKFVRPFQLVVAILRATEPSIADPAGLLDELANLGDAPFSWPTPDGAPDRRAWWESSLLSRWRFVELYMTNAIPGVSFDAEALFARSTKSDVVRNVDQRLTGGRLSASDHAALQQHVDSWAQLDASALRRLLTLAACAPSFQEV